MPTEFVELAGKINQQMPYHCVAAKAQRALNDRGLAVKGARIAIIGASAYKPGVGDVRESPALKMISLLSEMGAEVGLPRPACARAVRVRPLPARAARAGDRRRGPGDHRDGAPGRRSRGDRAPRQAGRRPARCHALRRRSRERREAVSSLEPGSVAFGDRGPSPGGRRRVGEDVAFGAYVVVHEGSVIGAECVIGDHAVLGRGPRLASQLRRGRAGAPAGRWSWSLASRSAPAQSSSQARGSARARSSASRPTSASARRSARGASSGAAA